MTEHQLAPENDEQTIFVEGLTDWEFIDNRRCSVADWIRSHLPSSTSAEITPLVRTLRQPFLHPSR